jgi:hypothetical protein
MKDPISLFPSRLSLTPSKPKDLDLNFPDNYFTISPNEIGFDQINGNPFASCYSFSFLTLSLQPKGTEYDLLSEKSPSQSPQNLFHQTNK